MGSRARPWLPLLAAGLVVLTPAFALPQIPAGGEFRVNTYTTGTQRGPSVALEPDGDMVVVWSSYLQDGSDFGIFGQRFTASGIARGAEFRVNTYTPDDQYEPSVAADARGRFVVVWNGYSLTPGIDADVRAQRYDAGGAPIGAEFVVNTYTPSVQHRAQVAAARSGDFVAAWQSPEFSATDVLARLFDRTGQPVTGGFLVNTTVGGYQSYPALDLRPDGGFVVTWMGPDDDGFGIFAQRFGVAGDRLGGEFRVNTYTTGDQRYPAVAVAAGGAFVVVWQSNGQDGSQHGVFGQRFGADGARQGDEFRVNTYTTGAQGGRVNVDADAQGNFVVTWATDATQDGSAGAAMARRFAANGVPRSGEFIVNTYTTGAQGDSHVAVDEVGNFTVAWIGPEDRSILGISAQRFGGLHPRALGVDTGPGPTQDGNGVLEPGEGVNVVPRWQNLNGAAQTFAGTIAGVTGPPGCVQVLLDGAGSYGTVANGATAPCTDCYRVLAFSSGRCQQHWDIRAVETLTPDIQGQVKDWALHVGESFTDVPDTSSFYKFVETLLHHDITGGCSATEFCPSSSTTREQMVVFVLLTREGAGYAPAACVPPNMFDDVPETSPFCRWVEEAARRGIAVGCSTNPPLFCPQEPVTRQQMSVLLLRTLDPALNPPVCVPGGERFGDVPASSPFCRWIEELARRGVVTGCSANPPLFCPASAVTREQMAVFLSATFGLQMYGT